MEWNSSSLEEIEPHWTRNIRSVKWKYILWRYKINSPRKVGIGRKN